MLLLTLLALPSLAQASPASRPQSDTITVTTTIQAAINAATAGDSVFIPAGQYTESLTLNKPVSLRGADAATTIIHAVANQRVLTVTGATITQSTVISGLSLTGGNPSGPGGGVLIAANASPAFNSIAVTNNQSYEGGGIFADHGSVLTLNTTQVLSNSSSADGGGAYAYGDVRMDGSRFERNISNSPTYPGDGGGLFAWGTLALTNTRFVSNTANMGDGGGVHLEGVGTLVDGWFEANRAMCPSPCTGFGGGLFARKALTLSNTSFVSNSGVFEGGGLDAGGPTTISGGRFEGNDTTNCAFAATNCIPTGGGTGGGLAGSNVTISGTSFIGNRGGQGAALAVAGTSNVINARIENNIAFNGFGGGIYVQDGVLRLSNTYLISNAVTNGDGGGIFVQGGYLQIEGSHFERNAAVRGGGARVLGATITDTDFVSNTASLDAGGGLYAEGPVTISISGGRFEQNVSGVQTQNSVGGGGLAVVGTNYLSSTTWVSGTFFLSNTSTFGGGAAVYGNAFFGHVRFERNGGFGGGLFAFGALTLSQTEFISNTGIAGGGLTAGPLTVIAGSRFHGNLATSNDGGGALIMAGLKMTGTEFIDNTAAKNGGGLAYDDDPADYHGIYDVRIVNSLFAGNMASSTGSSLYVQSRGTVVILHTTMAGTQLNPRPAIAVTTGTVGITDTIIASHTVGISRSGGTVYEDYNLFFGNTAPFSGTIGSGGHDQTGDPLFQAPFADDYHLQPGSAAIDHGINAGVNIDLDGNPRPRGLGFDIGAYEAPFTGTTVFLPLIDR